MQELFSPHHFIWIIPLGCFALFIIAATCYFLRREIASFFRKMFFPDTNRYILPASIISNVNTDKVQGPLTPEKIEAIIAAEEQKDLARLPTCPTPKPSEKPAKKKNTFLRRFETNFRWHFRHIKHAFGKWFAEFAGTEDSPSKASKVEDSTVKVMAERAENIPSLLPPQKEGPSSLPKQEEPKEDKNREQISAQEEVKEETKPEVKTESVQETPSEKQDTPLPKTEEPAVIAEVSQKPQENTPATPQEERQSKAIEEIPVAAAGFKERGTSFEKSPRKNFWNDFMSDRTAIIIALLILAGFAIFLGARVKLLGSIIMRQRVEMRNMQKQIEMLRYEQSGFKIVIHERAILPQKRYNR